MPAQQRALSCSLLKSKSTSACPQGTILPGVTRGAVIELARQRGYTVEETDVPITQAMEVRDPEFGSRIRGVTCCTCPSQMCPALAEACWLQPAGR